MMDLYCKYLVYSNLIVTQVSGALKPVISLNFTVQVINLLVPDIQKILYKQFDGQIFQRVVSLNTH